ncbi:leucine-rich repeat extensin-like protein 3 [Iris pallida]|uniref:Leucine-rich repeat extensin-like protein 3 n=1 Tax=Iris pallida TaxID=29817 RepID=A0AAX6H890_IRIPA|nr:leucine-rich repeat extensin-like protein 3 [Iris pallida]
MTHSRPLTITHSPSPSRSLLLPLKISPPPLLTLNHHPHHHSFSFPPRPLLPLKISPPPLLTLNHHPHHHPFSFLSILTPSQTQHHPHHLRSVDSPRLGHRRPTRGPRSPNRALPASSVRPRRRPPPFRSRDRLVSTPPASVATLTRALVPRLISTGRHPTPDPTACDPRSNAAAVPNGRPCCCHVQTRSKSPRVADDAPWNRIDPSPRPPFGFCYQTLA